MRRQRRLDGGPCCRTAVLNGLVRYGGIFDAVADFDAAVRDPEAPGRSLPAFDSGDHLHFNDAELQAMADAIDLASLTGGETHRPAPPREAAGAGQGGVQRQP